LKVQEKKSEKTTTLTREAKKDEAQSKRSPAGPAVPEEHKVADFMKKLAKSALIGTLTGLVVALFLNFCFPALLDRLENQTYYMRYAWQYNPRHAVKTDQQETNEEYGISIIDIDDRSQQKMGLYMQWDRSFPANLIKTINKHYPAAVVFDVNFFDPEDSNQAARLDKLLKHSMEVNPGIALTAKAHKDILGAIDYDEQLVQATREAGNVVHSIQMNNESDYPPAVRKSVAGPKSTMEWHNRLHPSSAITVPADVRKKGFSNAYRNVEGVIDGIFPELAQAAREVGCVDMPTNEDGVLRAVPVAYAFGTNPPVYLPISVRTIATLFGTPNDEITLVPGKYLDIGSPFKIFKDSTGQLRYSYPNVTSAQIKAILAHAGDILALAPRGRIEITSYLEVGVDKDGKRFVNLKAGLLPAEVTSAVVGMDPMPATGLTVGSSMQLAPGIELKRNSDVDWILTAPVGDGEWYLSAIDIRTLALVDTAAFSGLAAGKSRLLFHDVHVARNRDGKLVSSLPVLRDKALVDLCKTPWAEIEQLPPRMRRTFGDNVRIPLNSDNQNVITFFGGQKKSFPYYSYYDILNDRVHASLEGKIFVVGSSSQTFHDLMRVAHEENFPGPEVHASLMNSFLTNTFITRLSEWQDRLVLLLVGILIGIIAYLFRPLPGAITSIVMGFVYFLVAMMVFEADHKWIEVARPMLTIVLTFTAVMGYRYISEEKDRRFLQSTFKQYLSPELIDMMYRSKQQPKLGGDEGIRTAYFTDIQSFSTFSEKLGSPTRLVELLNEYLSAMTDILLARYGTLDKYEGDAIIAFFGAPMPMEDHAQQACATALDMQKKLGDLRRKWVSEGDKWPAIVHEMRMRIGLNTGAITTGNMGSAVRMNYTMMGDAVNLAARLESAAKQYGVYTMISQYTYDLVKGEFETRQIDKIRVVGKSEPVVVHELMAKKGELSQDVAAMVARYNQGLDAFYRQKWDEAVAALTETEKVEPYRVVAPKGMSPSKQIISYCKEFKNNPPPPDWDGVMQLTSK
jgi:class 3 adenylate cyclase/CHASE2 domain-containing sensor protein